MFCIYTGKWELPKVSELCQINFAKIRKSSLCAGGFQGYSILVEPRHKGTEKGGGHANEVRRVLDIECNGKK